MENFVLYSVKCLLEGFRLTAAFSEVSERFSANKSAHGPFFAHDFVERGARQDASSEGYLDRTLYWHVDAH